jgi:hypothetical protein
VGEKVFINSVEITSVGDHPINITGTCKGEAVAHEAVVNYREPTQPNPGYNEGFVVRSARPKGKECRS